MITSIQCRPSRPTLILSDYIFDSHFTVRTVLSCSSLRIASAATTTCWQQQQPLLQRQQLIQLDEMQETGQVERKSNEVPALIF